MRYVIYTHIAIGIENLFCDYDYNFQEAEKAIDRWDINHYLLQSERGWMPIKNYNKIYFFAFMCVCLALCKFMTVFAYLKSNSINYYYLF